MKYLWIVWILCCFSIGPAQAQHEQPHLVDGITLGVGVSIYIGDADGLDGLNVVKHPGLANLHVLLAVDRRVGRYGIGLETYYHRMTARAITTDGVKLDVTNNVWGLDAVGSYALIPEVLRVYAGVGPAFLAPQYHVFTAYDDEYKAIGRRWIVTTPFGLVVQDRIRVGMRLTWTDYLDGLGYDGSRQDVLMLVNLGYRFDLAD